MKKIKRPVIAALLFLALLGGASAADPSVTCPPLPDGNGPHIVNTVAVSVSYVPEADQTHG